MIFRENKSFRINDEAWYIDLDDNFYLILQKLFTNQEQLTLFPENQTLSVLILHLPPQSTSSQSREVSDCIPSTGLDKIRDESPEQFGTVSICKLRATS